jgi:hypothetical protein
MTTAEPTRGNVARVDTGVSTTPVEPGVGPLPVWIGVGVVGAVAMVVTGNGIGAIPHPAGDHWWFTVPIGTGSGAHLAFYVSVAILLAGYGLLRAAVANGKARRLEEVER